MRRIGGTKIHFEAPPAERVEEEMQSFLQWVNEGHSIDLVLKAAVAHLWFVTIHPFDDGNGRIGRAIADFLLARSEKSCRRFYSLSEQIQVERKQYYAILLDGFEGKLTSSKWAKMAQCSQDTAHRDIADLIDKGLLVKNAEGGRSSSYSLAAL
jgi:Fic family protein